MNPDFAIGLSAADAGRGKCLCISILQAPRNKADAALRTILCGLRNGIFLPFSVFALLCLAVHTALRLNIIFLGQIMHQAISETQNLG